MRYVASLIVAATEISTYPRFAWIGGIFLFFAAVGSELRGWWSWGNAAFCGFKVNKVGKVAAELLATYYLYASIYRCVWKLCVSLHKVKTSWKN